LVGPGGAGKTTLARQAAEDLHTTSGAEPVWLDLQPLTDTWQVPAQLIGAFQMQVVDGGRSLLDQLIDALRGWVGLLVLDNCEHLLQPGAAGPLLSDMIGRVLAAAPGMRVLATSRERLFADGELCVEVGGLETFPPRRGAAQATLSPAAQAFIAHAQRVSPRFDADADALHIEQICRLADGLPLALQLAAAWVPYLPCAEIAAELHRGIDILEPHAGQSTGRLGLRASFERSWTLAAAAQQRALLNLSIFDGPFSRELALRVAGVALPTLASLVDKSLLQRRTAEADVRARFSLHPLLRQYVEEKLAHLPDFPRTAGERLVAFVMQTVRSCEDASGRDPAALARFFEENEAHVVTAWRQATKRNIAEYFQTVANHYIEHLVQRGRHSDGHELVQQSYAQAAAGQPNPKLELELRLAELPLMYQQHGWSVQVEERALQALVFSKREGLEARVARAFTVLGHCAIARSRLDEATTYLDRAVALARQSGRTQDVLAAVWSRAIGHQFALRLDAAHSEVHVGLAEVAKHPSPFFEYKFNVMLGNLCCFNKPLRMEQGIEAYEKALRVAEEARLIGSRLGAIGWLARVLAVDARNAQRALDILPDELDTSRLPFQSAIMVLRARGMALTSIGKLAEARDWLARAVDTFAERQTIYDSLDSLKGLTRWFYASNHAEVVIAAVTFLRNSSQWIDTVLDDFDSMLEAAPPLPAQSVMPGVAFALPMAHFMRQLVQQMQAVELAPNA
jgi:predicted ATPase